MSAFRIEWRRTGAWPVAGVLLLVGIVLSVTSQPPFNRYGSWSSSWAGAGRWMNDVLLALGPLAAVAAAWVGGRERRRGMDELLATTSRSPLRRTSATWLGLTSGIALGMVLFAGFLAACIAPTVSYAGGWWPVSWALVGAGIVSCSALGFTAGRLVPGRLVAPVTGIVLYLLAGILDYLVGSWAHLLPFAHLPISEGSRLQPSFAVGDAVWVLALTAALVLLAAGRSARLPGVLALLAAAGVAVLLGVSSGGRSYPDPWTQRDPAAERLVCTRARPLVCASAVHAGLLPALTGPARRYLASARRVLPVDRVVERPLSSLDRKLAQRDLPVEDLSNQSRLLRSGLIDPLGLITRSGSELTIVSCRELEVGDRYQTAQLVQDVATTLLTEHLSAASPQPRRTLAIRDRLEARPGRARSWMTAYLRAGRRCDVPALLALAEPAP